MNKQIYSKLKKPMPYPYFIKDDIFLHTDYRKNRTQRVSRYVSYIEMLDGKPLERIFGFICSGSKRTRENMLIKEVARKYDHNFFLGQVFQCSFGGYKKPQYQYKDSFYAYKHVWNFYPCWQMTKPQDFLQRYDIKYSGWYDKCELDFVDFLTNYLDNPKCELLMKGGMEYWTKYIKHLDTSKKSLHEVFKINQDQVPLLQDKAFGYSELMVARKYGYTTMNEINTRLALRLYTRRYKDYPEIAEVLKAEETFKYLIKIKLLKNFYLNDYIDYIRDLKKLGALSDPKSLYPKQFHKAHRETSIKIEMKESEALIPGFNKSYKKYKKYEFKKGNLLIIAVKVPEQLYKESEVLGHCVRTYDQDVANGETEIMFIRQKSKPNKPYYTLELQGKKVEQVRGKDNKDPNKDVIKFLKTWAKKFNIKYTGEQEAYA